MTIYIGHCIDFAKMGGDARHPGTFSAAFCQHNLRVHWRPMGGVALTGEVRPDMPDVLPTHGRRFADHEFRLFCDVNTLALETLRRASKIDQGIYK